MSNDPAGVGTLQAVMDFAIEPNVTRLRIEKAVLEATLDVKLIAHEKEKQQAAREMFGLRSDLMKMELDRDMCLSSLMTPRLQDVELDQNVYFRSVPGQDIKVAVSLTTLRLKFSDRTVQFVYEQEPTSERVCWSVVSTPPHARDRSGYLGGDLTTGIVIQEALKP